MRSVLRFLLVAAACVVILLFVKTYRQQPVDLAFPVDLGKKVLSEVSKKIPNFPLPEVSLPILSPTPSPISEPIKEPAENVQNQTQQLIETIKKLPQDQLEAIKKQLFKDVCEQICQ